MGSGGMHTTTSCAAPAHSDNHILIVVPHCASLNNGIFEVFLSMSLICFIFPFQPLEPNCTATSLGRAAMASSGGGQESTRGRSMNWCGHHPKWNEKGVGRLPCPTMASCRFDTKPTRHRLGDTRIALNLGNSHAYLGE